MKQRTIAELIVAASVKNPAQRIGQLLQNAVDKHVGVSDGHRDLFYITDDELLSALTQEVTDSAIRH